MNNKVIKSLVEKPFYHKKGVLSTKKDKLLLMRSNTSITRFGLGALLFSKKLISKLNLIYISNKTKIKLLLIILSFLIFFSFPPIVTFDSSHYINYIHILENPSRLNTWDPVRGPVFPFFLFSIKKIFGFSPQIFLAIQFLLYISTFFLLLKLNKKLFKKEYLLLSLLLFLFNPIYLGYFHSILTEVIAIPLFLAISLISLKLFEIKNINKSDVLKYVFTISFLSIFTWQLKQPYFLIILFQLLLMVVIKIYKKEKVLHILVITLTSIALVILSNNLWINLIKSTNNNPRSSNGLLKNYVGIFFKETKENGLFFSIKKVTKNYLALADFYQIQFDKNANPLTTSNIILGKGNENNTIGLRFLSDDENIIGGLGIVPEKKYSQYLYQQNDINYLSKYVLKYYAGIYNYIYSIFTILIPFLIILFIIDKNYRFILISVSSFLFNLTFSLLSLQIDRYVAPVFLLEFISVISAYKTIHSLLKKKRKKYYVLSPINK
ncbi:MAG: hypothetical protein AAGU06_01095 [Candidatus Shapirobacteria bacterium]